jgi:hypothetical protein
LEAAEEEVLVAQVVLQVEVVVNLLFLVQVFLRYLLLEEQVMVLVETVAQILLKDDKVVQVNKLQ